MKDSIFVDDHKFKYTVVLSKRTPHSQHKFKYYVTVKEQEGYVVKNF